MAARDTPVWASSEAERLTDMETDDTERPAESEDHEGLAEDLEQQADRLEQENRRLGEEIGNVRGDWEAKRADPGVPGAAPPPDSD